LCIINLDGSARSSPRGETVVEQGQRDHRGRQEDGAADGQVVPVGEGRPRRLQERPHRLRKGHRRGQRGGHQARQGTRQGVHRQKNANSELILFCFFESIDIQSALFV